ncbi:MAG: hypothetical protein H0V36_11825 [Chloroflexi bacterium]|nr:hypothetical protein [Chloroflexota bacterium]
MARWPVVRRRRRFLAVAALAVSVIVVVPVVDPPPSSAAAATVAADSFTRALSGSWGSAVTGGPWTTEGSTAPYSVDGTAGLMVLDTPGANRAAALPATVALEVDVAFEVALDRAPTGSSVWAYGEARRTASGSYRLKVRLAPNGGVYLQASRVVGTTESPLGSEVAVSGLSHLSGAVRVRGQITGTAPTSLRLRAWRTGASEPADWPLSATDSTAALQTSGAIGLRAYASRSLTNAPITTRFDELLAVDVAAAGPPSPPPSTTIATDAFERTTATGWGTADKGGPWSIIGSSSQYRVDGTTGVMSLSAAGTGRAAWLPGTVPRDTSMAATVSVDRIPNGSSIWAYLEARRSSSSAAYRLKLRIGPDAGAYLRVSRVMAGSETNLAAEVRLTGVTVTPGLRLRVRGEASGADPTTLRARGWVDGQVEPGTWAISVSDATASLQGTAPVGLSSYLSSGATNPPISMRFDDLEVTDLDQTSAVLVGAGDIGVCGSTADESTAALLDGIAGTIFTAGDNAYPSGTPSQFQDCYGPSWGRHLSRTRPASGNHEYDTPGATGYFGYFGALAGDPAKGWYAYDLGAWRIRVLNSNCAQIGGCGAGSAQQAWLESDIAAYPASCSAAVWHQARFSSGAHGDQAVVAPLWNALYAAGTEVVIAGHDHDYERFAPMDATGAIDPTQGIRSFVVGTGGVGLRPFATVRAGSEVRDASTQGVLRLTLRDDGYDWSFIPIPGRTFTDNGSGTCH